jgi:hypothetical protein
MALENIDTTVFDLWLKNPQPPMGERIFVKGYAQSGSPDDEEEIVEKPALVTQDMVYAAMKKHGEPLSASGLARVLNVSNHSTAQCMRRLAKAGRVMLARQASNEKFWVAV